MAIDSKTLKVIVDADDKASRVLAEVSRRVDDFAFRTRDFARTGADITSPLAKLTAGVVALEGALIAGGIAMTKFAVDSAGAFDSSFREIGTLIDAPVDDLATFRDALVDYAAGSTKALEDITGSVYAAVSAGVDYADSLDVVRQSEKLAVGAKADLQDATTVLVSSLNAYGEEAGKAADYSDDLFTAVKQGQTTLPELSASLANVTGIAAGAKVPFETLLAAVAALTASGSPTSQAITQIKAAISNIIKPSSQAAETAAALGVQFDAAALQSQGLEGVLASVAEATGGNVDQMARLFGSTEALNAVIALTSTGAENFGEALAAMRDNTGATQEAFDKMADSVELGRQKIANAFRALVVDIGTPLLDEFGDIQTAVAAIFQALRESLDGGGLGAFVDEIEKMARDAADTLEAMARNLPEALNQADFGGFLGGVNEIRETLNALLGGADLTTAEGLASAIQAIGSAFHTLTGFTAAATQTLAPLLEQLTGIARTVAEMDPDLVKVLGTAGGATLVLSPLLSVVSSMATILPLAAKGVMALTGAISPLGLAVAAAGGAVVGLVVEISRWMDANDEAEAAEARAADSAERLAEKYREISETTGVAITNTVEFKQAIKDGLIVFDDATRTWKAAEEQTRDFSAEIDAAREKSYDYREALAAMTDANGNLVGALTKTAEAASDQVKALTEYYIYQGNSAEAAQAMAEAEVARGKATKSATEETEKALEKTESFRLKMLEIAADERIAGMELGVNLRVAQLEAETQRTVAAIESIGSSVEATTQLLGKMTDAYAGLDGGITGTQRADFIEKQIERQTANQEKLIASQVALNEAQAAMLEARADAITSGDGLIKIDSTGLEPALEMILWQILEKVQIRAAEDNAEFLLGI